MRQMSYYLLETVTLAVVLLLSLLSAMVGAYSSMPYKNVYTNDNVNMFYIILMYNCIYSWQSKD